MELWGQGTGVGVVFNRRARRVTPRRIRALAQALPRASIFVAESDAELPAILRRIRRLRPSVILSGGGDGTVVRLLNALRADGHTPFPIVGILPLGTGNAWARAVGAGPYREVLARLPALRWPPPTVRFDLLEVEGTLCHFAGAGLDARILDDYARIRRKLERAEPKGSLGGVSALGTYATAALVSTIPREVGFDSRGRMPWTELSGLTDAGLAVGLFSGRANLVAAGTCPEWGFGFKAFPFARAYAGHFNLRVFTGGVFTALRHLGRFWRGELPQPGMNDFLLARGNVSFSRPVPVEVGGDVIGPRTEMVLRIAPETADVIDWGGVRMPGEA